ncbi:hypothetical protein GR702_05435 [Novosphingobium sp. FGD1]|uniref:Uncharacterized protein n=1 Tax=Novosphingobium silvae TaxID=2692619 RepID=A0A7X4GEL4_9SPHN|nr:hypothetical protein [Novosphingobium silvae]MYL97213.1 hypothetical protein [Novosphingobium silvae]
MSADEFRTRETEDWIYAGDLVAQLGPRAARLVFDHVRQLHHARDYDEMQRWQGMFGKVKAVLLAETEPLRH